MTRVYFVCVGNSCRSQMAEGFAREVGPEVLAVGSGGTRPADEIDPTALEVMREVGIDISDQAPEPIDEGWLASSDHIVAMGCGVEETCPAILYDNMVDWDLDDPVGQSIEIHREVRDEIERRVRDLIDRVIEDAAPAGGDD